MDLKAGWLVPILTSVGILLVLVAGQTVQASTVFPGGHTVTGPETWTAAGSPYVVEGNLVVASGGHLTLEPGVEVRIMAGSLFIVQGGGMLNAEATALQPVTITAITGNFLSLQFHVGSRAILAYCDVSRAGASTYPPVDIQSSDVRLDHCTIRDSGVGSDFAVQLVGVSLSPTLTHTTVENNAGYAIYQSTIDMTPVYRDLTIRNNGTDAVVWRNGYLNRALTLDGQQIGGNPFLALESINVNGGAHLTLNPGTELRMRATRGLWVQPGGTLTVEGTVSDPIALTAIDSGTPWVKLCFLPGSTGSLDHCEISRAGASESLAVQIQSSDVVLDHCTIYDNIGATGAALRLEGIGLTPTIANTIIRDNSGRAVQQSTLNMTPVYANLTISGNGTDALVIDNGDLRRAVTLDGRQLNGSPIIGLHQINVWDQAQLTLNPGTELRLSTGDAIYVESGGTLIAEGTPAYPVAFTSVEPAAPFLKLQLLPGSTTRLAYCDVSHAGGSGHDALAVYSPHFTMSHCIVHDNAARGMRLFQGAGSPRLDNMVFVDNGGGGLYVEPDVDVALRHATFARNAAEGIRVRDGATAVLTNTIVAGHGTGINVVAGGSATMAHTLWDGNTQDILGQVDETGHFEGSTAFAADGYHLTASSAALNLGVGSGVTDDIDGEPRPLPAGTLPDLGADETGATLQSWQKWIDDRSWQLGFTLTVETLDTVEVVDLVAAASSVPFTLTESWDPAHLALSGYTLEPPGGGTVTTDTGRLAWQVTPGHAGSVTLSKRFAIQPCTWTATTLHESLEGLDIPDTGRPVSFHKTPPDLWIEASHGGQVHPGEMATATLTYGNNGGRETGIIVHADLAAGASLYDASPVPSWQASDGSEVRWQVAALSAGDSGQIGLSIAIAPDLLPPATVVITGQIQDHAGQAAAVANVTYQVAESPRHDVAVVSARPRGELPVAEPVAVTAELFNDGSETEEGVPVQCTIEGPASSLVYSETVSSGTVAAGAFAQIEFPAWTPAEAGTHTLICRSLLPGDEDPTDDVYSRLLTATLAGAPDVWTRDNEADTGDVPSGHPWWVSPDIWVRNQPDGGLVHQNPIVYQENTVYVRLRNRGTRAASGVVGVYWSRSRIGWPCKIWSPNVGTIVFEDLAPGEVRIVPLAWVPQEPGHHGLHTVIDAEGDPADWGAPCSPHWPRWDNNVSWRNTVAHFRPPKRSHFARCAASSDAEPAMRTPHALSNRILAADVAEVDLANPYDWPKDVDLIVERVTFPPTGTITIRLAEPLFDRWQAYDGHWSQGIHVDSGAKLMIVTGEVTATVGGIPMDAHEEVTATLLFDAPGEEEFEVTLQEWIDGLSVGGVRYQWLVSDVVPPAVVDHSPASGATEVPLDAPVVVTFTEEIGPLTFAPAFMPVLDGWTRSWNEAGTVFTVTHPAFLPGSLYSATVMAKDASANPLAVPYTWSFTAQEGWDLYLPLVVRDG